MRLVSLALLLAACGGSDDDPTDTDGTEIPEDTSAEETGTTSPDVAIDGAFFGVTGIFAFDDATDQHVPYVVAGGGPAPLSILVTLYDSSVQYSGIVDDTTTCTVSLEHDGSLPIAAWVEAHGAWAGFDLPRGATVRDGCRGVFGLPPEFAGDVGAAVAQWSWGVGVGPIDPYVEEEISGSISPSEWAALEPNLVGGVIISPLFAAATTATTASDGFSNSGFSLGYEVDGNFEIVVGGTGEPNPLPKEVIDSETGVATGYYEVYLGPWTGTAALANPAR
jgi:hypothetical protein